MQFEPVSVQQGKTSLQVFQPEAFLGGDGGMVLQGVLRLKDKGAFFLHQGKVDLVIRGGPVDPMLEDIFHEGHQQHGREDGFAFILLMKGHFDAMTDTYLFQGDIVFQELYFGCQGYFFFWAFFHEIPHDIGEASDQQGGAGGFPKGFIVDIVQGVEEKMRLDLGFEQVQFREAFLFQHLLRLLFELIIGDRDAEDEAKDIDDDTCDRKINDRADGKRLRGLCKIPVVQVSTQDGATGADAGEEYNGSQYIPNYPAFLIQAGEEETDIAVNDQRIEEGVERCIGDRLPEAIHWQEGKEVDQKNEPPDQHL